MSMNEKMDQGRCAEIFETVRRAAGVSDVEVTVTGGQSALTRFANNGITQNVSEEGCEVSVRVQMGGRTARATTNRLDEESLRRTVRQAEALARVQEEDAELLPMLTAAEQPSAPQLNRYCEATAAMGAGERAEQVEAMIAIALRDGLNSAGTYSSSENYEALFNSHGVSVGTSRRSPKPQSRCRRGTAPAGRSRTIPAQRSWTRVHWLKSQPRRHCTRHVRWNCRQESTP